MITWRSRSHLPRHRPETRFSNILRCNLNHSRPYFDAKGNNKSIANIVSDTSPVIEIRDLYKSYGTLEVLKGVSMKAPRGHVISLIGSSGSGKSTMLRCANLLEDSQSGEILFEGEPIKWRGSGMTRHPGDKAQVTRIRTNLSMVF